MGNPQHYGIELPERCLTLIDELWDQASRTYGKNKHLGPLTSTFLVSMSMPILNLPIERIERQTNNGDEEGYADDRHIDPKAVERFEQIIQRGALGGAPFFKPDVWRFVQVPEDRLFNTSRGLPEEVAIALASDDAAEQAAAMPANQWISVLRNALAHGGVCYLDEHGQTSYGSPVKMYAFVSGKYEGRALVKLNILRIAETDYRDFLRRWVAWLSEAGIAQRAA